MVDPYRSLQDRLTERKGQIDQAQQEVQGQLELTKAKQAEAEAAQMELKEKQGKAEEPSKDVRELEGCLGG